MKTTVHILMGSNMGDRESYLVAALDRLAAVEGLEIIATSAVYSSEAQDMEGENPAFLNQAVKADYDFTAGELLHSLEKIEIDLGRTGKGQREPRTIDLDILLFGEEQITGERLTVPHPELLNRPFALIPLVQIDPRLVHPSTGRRLVEYLTLKARQQVTVYRDHVARSI
ncbi:MAG: 2-amino-4-hydroxy-6-hydroxymethyldihydropteridine diphosphokinase [bacterium]|nr:2-amino-4-hydroxy-6-hydroxymethyldihydropteridine diphosphokinase [bacterium]